MRFASLVLVLAACGGSSKSAAVMAPASPPPPPANDPVAVNTPDQGPGGGGAPPSIAPDPCEGGEVTPTSGGIGQGVGAGNPCGGGPRIRERGHGPVVHLNGASVSGPLDKAIIRRYIKRNLNKIQYCYEKELVSDPGLKGSVNATFEIGEDGLVATSTATGLPVVADCVAGVIKTIEFPKPTGKVRVVYPFEFASSGT